MRPLVLNSRSKNQAIEFTSLLKGAGFDVLEIPALEISKIDCENQVIAALESFGSNDIVAFTSANAAVFISEDIRIKEMLGKTRIAAVGDKTATTLVQNDVSIYLKSPESSSEELAELVAAERPKKVLYLSGIPNTGTLKSKLSGILDFVEIPVYMSSQSATLQKDIVESQSKLEKVDALVFLSIETLNAFHSVVEAVGISLRDKECVVISQRVAEVASNLGYKKVTVSQARSVESIVDALLALSSGLG